jgi:hypothetical protein
MGICQSPDVAQEVMGLVMRDIEDLEVGKCDPCQKFEGGSRAYCELPPRHTLEAPWHEIHADLIGPRKIRVQEIDLRHHRPSNEYR